MFQPFHAQFLQQFLQECAKESQAKQIAPFYFFFCLVEDVSIQADVAETKIKAMLEGLAGHEQFNVFLPRLTSVNKPQIKSWLLDDITSDEGTADIIMDKFFAELPKTEITMKQAHIRLKDFLNFMNSGVPEVSQYINLY
jgi:hypothetical protein